MWGCVVLGAMNVYLEGSAQAAESCRLIGVTTVFFYTNTQPAVVIYTCLVTDLVTLGVFYFSLGANEKGKIACSTFKTTLGTILSNAVSF